MACMVVAACRIDMPITVVGTATPSATPNLLQAPQPGSASTSEMVKAAPLRSAARRAPRRALG
jgi:hypothetical protein